MIGNAFAGPFTIFNEPDEKATLRRWFDHMREVLLLHSGRCCCILLEYAARDRETSSCSHGIKTAGMDEQHRQRGDKSSS